MILECTWCLSNNSHCNVLPCHCQFKNLSLWLNHWVQDFLRACYGINLSDSVRYVHSSFMLHHTEHDNCGLESHSKGLKSLPWLCTLAVKAQSDCNNSFNRILTRGYLCCLCTVNMQEHLFVRYGMTILYILCNNRVLVHEKRHVAQSDACYWKAHSKNYVLLDWHWCTLYEIC